MAALEWRQNYHHMLETIYNLYHKFFVFLKKLYDRIIGSSSCYIDQRRWYDMVSSTI